MTESFRGSSVGRKRPPVKRKVAGSNPALGAIPFVTFSGVRHYLALPVREEG